MDEDFYYEMNEGSDVDNWEEEQVFQDQLADKEECEEGEFWEPEPREDFGYFGEAGLWD